MLLFGDSLDLSRDSKRFTPSRNLGFNLSFSWEMFCITSASLVGEGREKLSNPEKKFKIDSETAFCWSLSSLVEVDDSLKTLKNEKRVRKINLNILFFIGSEYWAHQNQAVTCKQFYLLFVR